MGAKIRKAGWGGNKSVGAPNEKESAYLRHAFFPAQNWCGSCKTVLASPVVLLVQLVPTGAKLPYLRLKGALPIYCWR